MLPYQILAAEGSGTAQVLFDAAQSELTANLPIILAGIGAIAAVAFGIKGLWVAWRAGSKAVGKTGS